MSSFATNHPQVTCLCKKKKGLVHSDCLLLLRKTAAFSWPAEREMGQLGIWKGVPRRILQTGAGEIFGVSVKTVSTATFAEDDLRWDAFTPT